MQFDVSVVQSSLERADQIVICDTGAGAIALQKLLICYVYLDGAKSATFTACHASQFSNARLCYVIQTTQTLTE